MLDAPALARVLRACGVTPARADAHAPALADYGPVYGVTDTPLRLAHFTAQVCAESGAYRWMRELWGPTASQRRYEPPSDLARRLGNLNPGDGYLFRGGGPIQTTGRANYRALTKHLRARGIDCPNFEAEPEEITEEPWATLSALAWWDDNGANAVADRGDDRDDVLALSRLVNLGDAHSGRMPNGFPARLDYFLKAATAIRREAGMDPKAPLTAWPRSSAQEASRDAERREVLEPRPDCAAPSKLAHMAGKLPNPAGGKP